MKQLFLCTMRQIALVTAAAVLCASAVRADDHVVPLSDLHNAIAQSSTQRDANRAAIDHFFSQPRVRATLKDAGIDAAQVQRQALLLSDEEQSQLAARARAADAQISGGELKDSQVTLIILSVTLFAFLAVLVLAFK